MDRPPAAYELVDAGDGRRLERFGTVLVDRPAPAAAGSRRQNPGAWALAAATYERGEGRDGRWVAPASLPVPWAVPVDGLELELRLTPAGQVGLFPEHLPVARWAAARASDASTRLGRPAEVLNLFAHTGLVTLAVAAVGARVAHVDASRPAVGWARHNAVRSGLADRPIRWLVDDAARFTARELRRGRRYDGVVLDPPTYGHGPRGDAWELGSGLHGLLEDAGRLLGDDPWFLACTAHAAGLDPGDLERTVRDAIGRPAIVETVPLVLGQTPGPQLGAGAAVLAVGPPERVPGAGR